MGRSADLERHPGETDGDDSECPILHVDMDAFFASVEIRRRPELRGQPVVVGGGTRGVVAAASYEARRYGIRSAMAMSVALRRCPKLVVLPVDRQAYSQASRSVMAIFRDVTALVEPLSLDEAFLDVTPARLRMGRPVDIARFIRRRVEAELGLTCSIGVAPTKFVAKIASARCKPNGLLVVPRNGMLDFLHPLPITALWGVGPSAAERLARLGLRSIGDVAETATPVLARAIGEHGATHLTALAHGIDRRPVSPHHVEKSVSSESTFALDLTDAGDIHRELLRLSDEVAVRLRAGGLLSRTVGIKVRFADFRTVTRARTLPDSIDGTSELHRIAVDLFDALALDRARVRLLGVKAEALLPAATATRQLTLDGALLDLPPAAQRATAAQPTSDQATAEQRTAEQASRTSARAAADLVSDAARRRFGFDALVRATLVRAPPKDGAAAAPTDTEPS